MVPKGVMPSYVLAFGYVLADTQDKARKQYRVDGCTLTPKLAISAGDCLLW